MPTDFDTTGNQLLHLSQMDLSSGNMIGILHLTPTTASSYELIDNNHLATDLK